MFLERADSAFLMLGGSEVCEISFFLLQKYEEIKGQFMHGRTVFPVVKVLKILPSKNLIFGDFQVSIGGT